MLNPLKIALLSALVCAAAPAGANNGKVAFAYPVADISVDGDLSDWPDGLQRYAIANVQYRDPLGSDGDLNAEFRVGYNTGENALYVAVEVVDDSIWEQPAPGEAHSWDTQDGCELNLHLAAGKGTQSPVAQYGQYGDQLDSFGADPRQIVVGKKRVGNTYYYEWRADIGAMGKGRIALRPGALLGFDVAIWDRDEDGSNTWAAWGAGIVKSSSTLRLGIAVMTEPDAVPAEVRPLIESVIAHNAGFTRDAVRQNATYQMLFTAVPLCFALLHLLIFAFYPRMRENLYYAAFIGCFGAYSFFSYQINEFAYSDGNFWTLYLALTTSLVCGAGFFYSLFSPRWPRPFWILPVISLVLLVLAWRDPLGVFVPFAFLTLFYLLEYFRVIGLALYRRITDAWIIGVGASLFVLFMVAGIFSMPIVGILADAEEMGNFLIQCGSLAFAFSMSVYLARQFAQTNKDLEKQLAHVHELSTQALAEEIERTRLEAEIARKTEELEEARALQLSLLPQEVPQLPDLDIAWQMETATEVGGDYYDYAMAPDGTLTLALGDATGHGMRSGNVVTATKGLFLSLADHPDIPETLATINKSLHRMKMKRMAMAMCMVKIAGRAVEVSSAGLPPVYFYHAAEGQVEEVLVEGTPLGLVESATYRVRRFDLQPGDTLLLLTDGLPERHNADDEDFGYPRTQQLFAEVADQEPAAICRHLGQGCDQWAGDLPRDDDVTFVVLKAK